MPTSIIIIPSRQLRLCDVDQQVEDRPQVPALLSSPLSLERLGSLQ
jgi:hypothetical protein